MGMPVGNAHLTIRRDDLRLEETGCSHSPALGEAAESARLNVTADANGGASAALDIAIVPGGDEIVEMQELRAAFDGDGRLWRILAFAVARHKRVVNLQAPHAARPQKQAIRRIGLPQVTVAAPLDHEPEVLLPCEIDRGDNVGDVLRGHRVYAGRRRPSVEPAYGLRAAWLLLKEEWVGEALQCCGAAVAVRAGEACTQRRRHLDQPSADSVP
jgi:hypothetical protein